MKKYSINMHNIGCFKDDPAFFKVNDFIDIFSGKIKKCLIISYFRFFYDSSEDLCVCSEDVTHDLAFVDAVAADKVNADDFQPGSFLRTDITFHGIPN